MKTVTFLSPGSFVAEQTTKKVEGKSIEEAIFNAVKEADNVEERYGAIPYAFTIEGINKTFYLPHCQYISLDNIEDRNEVMIRYGAMMEAKRLLDLTQNGSVDHFSKELERLREEFFKYDSPTRL